MAADGPAAAVRCRRGGARGPRPGEEVGEVVLVLMLVFVLEEVVVVVGDGGGYGGCGGDW